MKKSNVKTLLKSKKSKKAQSKAKKTQSHADRIDVVIDHANTLKELSHDVVCEFYNIHYIPIKQACTAYGMCSHAQMRTLIEMEIDVRLQLMNDWISQKLDIARRRK